MYKAGAARSGQRALLSPQVQRDLSTAQGQEGTVKEAQQIICRAALL